MADVGAIDNVQSVAEAYGLRPITDEHDECVSGRVLRHLFMKRCYTDADQIAPTTAALSIEQVEFCLHACFIKNHPLKPGDAGLILEGGI